MIRKPVLGLLIAVALGIGAVLGMQVPGMVTADDPDPGTAPKGSNGVGLPGVDEVGVQAGGVGFVVVFEPGGSPPVSGATFLYSDGTNLGIGTSNPTAKVHSVSDASIPNFLAESGIATLAVPDGQAMRFGHWDGVSTFTSRMHIKSDGNVAIGTTTANGLVHMASSDINTDLRIANTSGAGGRSRVVLKTDEREWRVVNDGNLNVFKVNDQTAGADRLVIDEAGEVGIGVSNPTAKVHSASTGGVPSYLAAGSTADFAVPDGQAMQLGHWDGVGTFTSVLSYESDDKIGRW